MTVEPRKVTLFTGQWADLPLATLAEKAARFGYDGLELACWGDHFDVARALDDDRYCGEVRDLLERQGLGVWAISNHLVGQAVCDRIDQRHQSILPPRVWGDGDPEGVRQRAAEELARTARAARRLGVDCVNGFTGSSIWHLAYSFPPVAPSMIEAGFEDFARRFGPILDVFAAEGVRFGLEIHPTEIAFDLATAERAVAAVEGHRAFGFNYDPSHLGYQSVDYVELLYRLRDRIVHVHVKDVWWSESPRDAGTFGGYLPFGDRRRSWNFRSPGRGAIDFEPIVRALNEIGYRGPLSVEWEDDGMDREHGAAEACEFVRGLEFPASRVAFDAAFERRG